MSSMQHSPEARALLATSARHLLNADMGDSLRHYRQLWQAAQCSGDREAQLSIRAQVVSAGRELQARRTHPQAKALWLALLGLRCSMVMPRMRF
ncbi:hypothetical protein [Comamonas guangdongensis]|uniref:Uncharacterized protein n=1 Tax=Comamonas guangdongensis TaxID=510515 RepID=A0ABV3ZQV6_9BURK